MRIRPDGTDLVGTVVVTMVLGVVVLTALFAALQIVTGELNMADVLHHLPRPVAAVFVDDADDAMTLDCDGLDETDPDAVTRYAADRGLEVEHVPAGAAPVRLAGVEFVFWRDRLIAYAEGEPPPPVDAGTVCPG